MKYWLVSRQDGFSEIIEAKDPPKMWSDGGIYTSRSRRYDSRIELLKDKKVQDTPCKECGGVISGNWMGNLDDKLKEKCLCFSCNHWQEIVEDKNNVRRVFVNGTSYWRKDYRKNIRKEDEHVLGFSGSIFKIKMNDGSEYTTNDMWSTGLIPERFKERLPDNAIFLK